MNVYSCKDIDDEFVSLNIVVNPNNLLSDKPEVSIEIIDEGCDFGNNVELKISLDRYELGNLISKLTKIKTIIDAGESLYE